MNNPYNYTAKQIDDTLRMKHNLRKVSFRYDLLNRRDIKIGELSGITGEVTYGEFKPIKRSAVFQIDEYLQKEIDYMSDQIQPWFILHMPDGGTVEWPLGIFLLESPDRNISGKIVTREIGAYDKTIIIEEDRFAERFFIASGTNYVGAVIKILTSAGIVNINITETDLTLRADREFEIGKKKKEAINELLNEINYNSIRVDESGVFVADPYVEPSQRQITHIYRADRDSITATTFRETTNIAGRANKFIAIGRNIESETEYVSVFVNSDPLSRTSTVNRGREIAGEPYILESVSSQEVLDNYIRRIAIENSSAYNHFSMETALMPTHGSAETLFLYIPSVFGETPVKFSETGWVMDLKYNGSMQHEARRVIQI